jgi:hypothetical protein
MSGQLSRDDRKGRVSGLSYRSHAFIGKFAPSVSGKTFDCINPAAGHVLTQVAAFDKFTQIKTTWIQLGGAGSTRQENATTERPPRFHFDVRYLETSNRVLRRSGREKPQYCRQNHEVPRQRHWSWMASGERTSTL